MKCLQLWNEVIWFQKQVWLLCDSRQACPTSWLQPADIFLPKKGMNSGMSFAASRTNCAEGSEQMIACIHWSHLASWSQRSQQRGTKADRGHLAAGGCAPIEVPGGLLWEPQVTHCPALALKKYCAAGNEMEHQSLAIDGGTANPLSCFARTEH